MLRVEGQGRGLEPGSGLGRATSLYPWVHNKCSWMCGHWLSHEGFSSYRGGGSTYKNRNTNIGSVNIWLFSLNLRGKLWSGFFSARSAEEYFLWCRLARAFENWFLIRHSRVVKESKTLLWKKRMTNRPKLGGKQMVEKIPFSAKKNNNRESWINPSTTNLV